MRKYLTTGDFYRIKNSDLSVLAFKKTFSEDKTSLKKYKGNFERML